MNRIPENILMYGKAEALPKVIELRAGAFTASYSDGFIRYIKLGDTEILRMINYMVRDHNWNTVPQQIVKEDLIQTSDSFEIRFRSIAELDSVRFQWDCEIVGNADCSIRCSIEGKALTRFKRNRAGFTVLHPGDVCRGKEVTIVHSDGSLEKTRFPDLISPHQPFKDISEMRWKSAGSIIKLKFTGEIFETEDQRNWTDDSYKTYCTPLSKPFPQQLEVGTMVAQTIELTLSNNPGIGVTIPDPDNHSFTISEKYYMLPQVGVARSSDAIALAPSQIDLLKAINFDHYQADLFLFRSGWNAEWEAIKSESELLGLGLEISLFFNNAAEEVQGFIETVSKTNCDLRLLNLFDQNKPTTSIKTISAVLPGLNKVFPETRIGAGSNAFFTELNRDRIRHPGLDYLVYSFNPQVHAFDNASLVEALNAQPYTVKTAKSFSSGKPIHISPVTLKMRLNPNATDGAQKASDAIDPRQKSMFAASWILGCFQNLLPAEPALVTFFETVGQKGLLDDHTSQLTIYPMYFVFRYLLNRKDQPFFPIIQSDSLLFGGLIIGPDKREFILVNYTEAQLPIDLPPEIHIAKGQFIDAEWCAQLVTGKAVLEDLPTIDMDCQITLPPFSLGFFTR